MTDNATRRTDFGRVQAQAARKLAEIHQMMAPGIMAPFSEDDLRRATTRHMARLSPEERDQLRLRSIVAYAELQQMTADLSRHLADIEAELKKVGRQSRAVNAYAQASRFGRRSPIGL